MDEHGIGRNNKLSCREVNRLRKWINDKEREERRNNVIVRGIRISKEIEKDKKEIREWAKRIKEKIGVDCKVRLQRKWNNVSNKIGKCRNENGNNEKQTEIQTERR